MTAVSPENKIFIIGLPRTGTTSICCKLLTYHFTVAHTAYTEKTFKQAQVIADTPIFADYPQLFHHYPNSKFIYLERDLNLWLPSIKQLLLRMHRNINREDGGFNPIIKRCYKKVFSEFTLENIQSNPFLTQCYRRHQNEVYGFFEQHPNSLLTIDISLPTSLAKLLSFLKQPVIEGTFDKMNIAGKVTAWKDLKHSNKVESTNNGRSGQLPYL